MKRVEAIIRPERLTAVKDALAETGHRGMTVWEVKGHGIQHGVTQQWRGEDYVADLLPKACVVVVVHDHEAPDCVDAIAKAARTGRMGDGKIFVMPVEHVIRIQTNETGPDAL